MVEAITKVFTNKALAEAFHKNGYVVIDLLTNDDLSKLQNLYDLNVNEVTDGFSTTIHSNDFEFKKDISNNINEIVKPRIDNFLEKHRSLGCSFLTKTPTANSYMSPHQDWMIVNEEIYFSATVWIPLSDTDEINSTLRVIPGSHLWNKAYRSPTIKSIFESFVNDIFPFTIPIPLRKGQAIIFNHALIHASSPNTGKSNRIVASYGFVPVDSELKFYHQPIEGYIEELSVEDDFFISYNNIGQMPEKSIPKKSFNYTVPEVNIASFISNKNIMNISKMKKLFAEEKTQDFFNKNGYVKIPMLDKNEIDALLSYYHSQKLIDNYGSGFSMSMEIEDEIKVREIRQKIFEIALPKAMPHFHDAKPIAGSFVVKFPNPTGVVPPHQDWSFVEEEGIYYSVTCWIALVDTTIENGCMGVIPGSHLLMNNLRPSPSPQVPTPLSSNVFSIFPYFKMYEMKAGEALIFDHRTFHGSTPNITDDLRIAVGLGFTQKEAKICHYNLVSDGEKNKVNKYYINDDFLMKFNNHKLSKMYDNNETISGYEIAEQQPFYCPNYTLDELNKLFTANGNIYDSMLAEKLTNYFGTNSNQPNEIETSIPKTEIGESQKEPNTKNEEIPFWRVYTPVNILREIAFRLKILN